MSEGRRGVPGRAACAPVLLAAVAASTALTAAAQALTAHGACREGRPHGAWEVVAADGSPRALGAFNRGKRTGSFIFWNDAGVRVAHVPYEDDAKSGTLALWYPRAAKGAEAPKRLEAGYAAGRRNGVTRSWHPDGRARGEYRYAEGGLAAARAWDGRGRELGEAEARAQAAADAAADEAYYAMLDAIVARHLPACRAS